MTTIDTTYRARPGFGLSNKQAAIVGPELRKVLDTAGRLDPKVVVHAAKPPNSRLHRFFEWDDRKAATQYRMAQARHLIKSIEVVVETSAGSEFLPAFYSAAMTSDDTAREYLPLDDLLTEPSLLHKQIQRFVRDIQRVRDEYAVMRRAAPFDEVAGPILDAADEMLKVPA